MIDDYLESAIKQFEYYKYLGDETFESLHKDAYFQQSSPLSNSIAVIVQHLYGNMMSRWTDFLTTDGEKEWRNREQEFELYLKTEAEVKEKWEKGWTCLFDAMETINNENFKTTIYIRNQGHTIIQAINRQLCHYSYHIGQIVFIGREQSKNWNSLSIAKGESVQYNKQQFDEGKRKEHFTDKFIKKDNH